MTPKELHEICHQAAQECPQFCGYDDDQRFMGEPHSFGDMPNGGFVAVIKLWKEEGHLFNMGYEKCLPNNVRQLFDDVDQLFAKAVELHFK